MVVPARRGNVREAGALAQGLSDACRAEGNQDRSHGRPSTARHVPADDGEPEKAREHLETATKLYDATADRVTAVIYGTDVQVTSLSNLCIVDWLLGRVDAKRLVHGRGALESGGAIATRAHPRLRLCPRLHAAHAGAGRADGRDPGAAGAGGRNETGATALDLGGQEHFSAGPRSSPAAWRRASTRWRSSAISCTRRS